MHKRKFCMQKRIVLTATSLLIAAVLLAGANLAVGKASAQPAVQNPPTVVATENAGELRVSWNNAPGTNYYTVGWISKSDISAMQSDGRNWLDAFRYVTITGIYTSHTIRGLEPGDEYYVNVGAQAQRFGGIPPTWTPWSDAVTTSGQQGTEVCPPHTPTTAAGHLQLSKTIVVANESIIIVGSGFGSAATIDASKITLDGEPLDVDLTGTANGKLRIDSSGQFVFEARIWSVGNGSNPALVAGVHTLKVVDSAGFEGEAEITILEPVVTITPEVAGPRDYIAIYGENWPMSTFETGRAVSIFVDGRDRSEAIDTSGRFTHQVRLSSDINLGGQHYVEVVFEDSRGRIYKSATFRTPTPSMTITPEQAQPGDFLSIRLFNMPVFTLVESVRIAGSNRLGNTVINTDRDGNATVGGIVVPVAAPGHYNVHVAVGGEAVVAQLEILPYEHDTSDNPAPGITIMPEQARPGELVTIELVGMPVFELVTSVSIAGGNRLGNTVINTDRNGNATVEGIIVPDVAPGIYSVHVTVGRETVVGQLEILPN